MGHVLCSHPTCLARPRPLSIGISHCQLLEYGHLVVCYTKHIWYVRAFLSLLCKLSEYLVEWGIRWHTRNKWPCGSPKYIADFFEFRIHCPFWCDLWCICVSCVLYLSSSFFTIVTLLSSASLNMYVVAECSIFLFLCVSSSVLLLYCVLDSCMIWSSMSLLMSFFWDVDLPDPHYLY